MADFGTKTKPVILDISQVIRRVAWITGPDILMIRIFAMLRKPGTPTTRIEQPIAYNGDAFKDVIHDYRADAKPIPTVELPTINGGMMVYSLDWNNPPLKDNSANETFNIYSAVLFFNLPVLKREQQTPGETYEVKVIFPGNTKKPEPATTYYAFWNFGTLNWETAKAFPLQIPYYTSWENLAKNITDVGGNIQFWTSAAPRDQFVLINSGEGWGSHEETVQSEVNDLFQWECEAWTFKRRKEFPLDKENFLNPTDAFGWQGDEKTKGHEFFSDGAYMDSMVIPSRTVTFRVKYKTLELTATKV